MTEKRELASSIESQSRRQTAFSLSASYQGITVAGEASAEASAEDTESHRQSRTDSMDITRKASARSRRDHKVSFRVTTQVGTETEEQHLLINPSQKDSMRLDYFRLLREWQVSLYRYGLRMTYDIVIPHPGLPMLVTASELHQIQRELAAPFTFDVPFDYVTPDTYRELERRFGITLIEPPPETMTTAEERLFERQGDQLVYDALEFDVEPDYVVARAHVSCRFDVHIPDSLEDFRAIYLDVAGQPGPAISTGTNEPEQDPVDCQLHLDVDLDQLVGRSGRLSIILVRRELGEGSVTVTLEQELRPEVRPRWANGVWLALREAAHQQWALDRQLLLDRVERLEAEIGGYDALTLRKLEREAIMRGVLQWLFGPGFELGIEGDCVVPSDGVDIVDPATWSAWQRVAQYGELIRFLQQAIEWENVLYLGYPYFWDTPSNWGVKANLRHPDFRHQEFLRAGFFRVVLTVRPGYEHDLITLTETGVLAHGDGTLADTHRYLTIANEIRAKDEELYPPLPVDASGEAEEEQDRGRLIGRWREHTPVSGLDISVNTSLGTIA